MGDWIISNEFLTPTAYVSSGDATGFPALNVGDYRHPWRRWKSSGAVASGTTYVGVDLGSNKPARGVVVDNINLASVKVQNSDNGSSWTDDATVTVSQDQRDGRYKFYLPLPIFPSWNHRYLRVLANTGTTTDGASAMSVGTIAVLLNIQQVTDNFEVLSYTPRIGVIQNDDFASGAMEPVQAGNRFVDLEISSATLPNTTSNEGDITTILQTYGPTTPFVFYQLEGLTQQVYIVYQVGTVRVDRPTANVLSFSGLVLREVS